MVANESPANANGYRIDAKHLRWLTWLPVALLLVGIAAQAIAMQTINADPQAGSGFSMFSTADFAGSRQVVATGSIDGTTVSIDVPSSLSEGVAQLKQEPTDGAVVKLAETLAAMRWTIDGDRAVSGDDVQLDRVDVAVFGLRADGRSLSAQLLAGNTP